MIPIVMFMGLTIVLGLFFWFRYKSRTEVQRTIREALGGSAQLTPEMIDRLGHPRPNKNQDLRVAMIWLAIAGGLALMGFAVPDPSGHALGGLLASAAIPFALGVAYVIIWRFAGRD